MVTTAACRAHHQERASGHGCMPGLRHADAMVVGPWSLSVFAWSVGVTHRRVVVAVVLELHGEVDDGADRWAALALGLP